MSLAVRTRLIKPSENDELSPKPDTSIGCLKILFQGIPTALSVDKGVIFNEQPGLTIVCLSSMSRILAVIYNGL